ncbi:hypothetical protein SISNIDRAFT_14557 [Sistotremastrum niveocremeum HHB9708]|uniref:Uncharacterized protein n=2 Tax=Sistotremastraceae TaxID=3402574 RepID=A0A165AKU0_9AGAM|nr:hypothetical protein SISNIDRAFT_14557 [Sistotremastrum niveocremeum HHB9708]KZT42007.1 hypothetical protein SISSUDRAFT_141799 [Sistotremastrum suecicum HHB10207 ss-3]
MSKRLASFGGPSTPPPRSKQAQFVPSPSSPSRVTESTYHRKARSLLYEFRTAARTWDDLILHDGLRAAKTLIDTRTELDNELGTLPAGTQPRTRLVGPKLAIMDEKISELDAILAKLKKQFYKMNHVVDSLETLMFEAQKVKGWQWVQEEPLWTTWSLHHFYQHLANLTRLYSRSLFSHEHDVETLRPHSVSFEDSRNAINDWTSQPHLGETLLELEDLYGIEVDRPQPVSG